MQFFKYYSQIIYNNALNNYYNTGYLHRDLLRLLILKIAIYLD